MLNDIRLGPSQAGSYVLTLRVPVEEPPQTDLLNTATPLTRRTVVRLFEAVNEQGRHKPRPRRWRLRGSTKPLQRESPQTLSGISSLAGLERRGLSRSDSGGRATSHLVLPLSRSASRRDRVRSSSRRRNSWSAWRRTDSLRSSEGSKACMTSPLPAIAGGSGCVASCSSARASGPTTTRPGAARRVRLPACNRGTSRPASRARSRQVKLVQRRVELVRTRASSRSSPDQGSGQRPSAHS